MKPRTIGLTALKLCVTGALMFAGFHNVNFAPVLAKLGNMHIGWAALAILVLFGQLVLTGLRWYYVDNIIGVGVAFGLAMRLTLVGQFFNQVLPSSVGGDGVRAWLLANEGYSAKHSLVSVMCDRIGALIFLVTIAAVTLPMVLLTRYTTIPAGDELAIVLLASTAAGFLLLYTVGEVFSTIFISNRRTRPIGVLIRDLRRMLFSSKKSAMVAALAVLVQILVVLSVYLCALALGVELQWVHLLMMPLIMLVASMPLSFAGWGLRETAMVTGLGFAGVAGADALAVSVSFGIAQLVIGLPGIIVFAFAKRSRRMPGNA